MAIRKKLSHDMKTREKIQTTQLINRLTKQALGELELTNNQIKAIEILLRKTLPDLSQVTQDVLLSGSVQVESVQVEFVESKVADKDSDSTILPTTIQ